MEPKIVKAGEAYKAGKVLVRRTYLYKPTGKQVSQTFWVLPTEVRPGDEKVERCPTCGR